VLYLREQAGVVLFCLGLGACLISTVFLGVGADPARCALVALGGLSAVVVGAALVLYRP
jgi:hypothetical protein